MLTVLAMNLADGMSPGTSTAELFPPDADEHGLDEEYDPDLYPGEYEGDSYDPRWEHDVAGPARAMYRARHSALADARSSAESSAAVRGALRGAETGVDPFEHFAVPVDLTRED